MKYIIPKTLHDLLEIQFKGLYLSYQDNDLYIIDKTSIDRVISNGLAIDDWFMLTFQKSSIPYLLQYLEFPYRVLNYITAEFKSYPIENINFKYHLRGDIALVKTNRTFHTNAKPSFVEYEIEGELIARRKWEFLVNSDTGFPEDIKIFLAYYRQDGKLGDYFLINHDTFNPLNDVTEIMTELERPRRNKIKQIKGLVYSNLSVSNPMMTHEEKLLVSGKFYSDYSSVINSFIEIGISKTSNPNDEYIINKILRDINPLPEGIEKYPFLDHPYFMDNNFTLAQIIISILDY